MANHSRDKLTPFQRQVLADLRAVERTMKTAIPDSWPFWRDEDRFPPRTVDLLVRKGWIARRGRCVTTEVA
jgi:hypothetical protein